MKKGFTLVETLVAIFIITTAIAGAMAATQRSLQTSFYSRDQVVTFFLAEEAMEAIRNIRDTNFKLNKANWLESIPVPSTNGQSAVVCVDWVSQSQGYTIYSCSNFALRYNNSTGQYGHTLSGPATINTNMSRKITLTRVSADQVLVEVEMRWKTGSQPERSYQFHKTLLNWK